MEPSEFGSALHNFVTGTSSYAHIFKLLRLLDIENLKVFAHEQIKKMNNGSLRTAHHTILPMNQLLPRDVIQNVLSFGYVHDKYAIKLVCKQWNRLYNLNEDNTLRAAYQRVMDQFLEKLPPENSTWVLEYERRQPKLLPVETRLGLQGPLRNVDEVMERCKSGDRVLIHETLTGCPENALYSECTTIEKDIHFVGLSPVNYGRCWFPWIQHFHGQVILENLMMNPCDFEIGCNQEKNKNIESKLTMRNCKVQSKYENNQKFVIKFHKGSSLEMDSCDIRSELPMFDFQGEQRIPVAMEISPFAKKININHCKISRFERGIVIQRLLAVSADSAEIGALADINIKNTVFEDISEYAVVERTHPDVHDEGVFIKPSRDSKGFTPNGDALGNFTSETRSVVS